MPIPTAYGPVTTLPKRPRNVRVCAAVMPATTKTSDPTANKSKNPNWVDGFTRRFGDPDRPYTTKRFAKLTTKLARRDRWRSARIIAHYRVRAALDRGPSTADPPLDRDRLVRHFDHVKYFFVGPFAGGRSLRARLDFEFGRRFGTRSAVDTSTCRSMEPVAAAIHEAASSKLEATA